MSNAPSPPPAPAAPAAPLPPPAKTKREQLAELKASCPNPLEIAIWVHANARELGAEVDAARRASR